MKVDKFRTSFYLVIYARVLRLYRRNARPKLPNPADSWCRRLYMHVPLSHGMQQLDGAMSNRAVHGKGPDHLCHPFNKQTLLSLDMAITALETAPSWNRLALARLWKRWYEHTVPSFVGVQQ